MSETETADTDRPVAYTPHQGPQTEFHSRTEDFVLFGGSKFPGKTHALLFESTRQVDKARYKALILRRTFPQLQELMDRAQEHFPKMGARWEGEEKRWRFPSGATIKFGHCEHEGSKTIYQGQQYAFIGFDQLEEFIESQVRFIMAQNRTDDPEVDCYVRATANPGGIGHWWILRQFIRGKVPLRTYTQEFGEYEGRPLTRTIAYVPATIYDNPTGLKANPQYLAMLMSLPEQERKALLQGDWTAYDTGCAFDSKALEAQETLVRDPLWVGMVRDEVRGVEFVMDPQGFLRVWKQPQAGSRYMIAADVAKGIEGGDNSVAVVMDRSFGEIVATWKGKIDATDFGNVLYGLGLYYKSARIAVESWPGPGIATVGQLRTLGYPLDLLYRRRVWDGEAHKTSDQIGYTTDERGRLDLVTALQNAVSHSRIIVRDREALDEMRSFVRNERGRYEARSGSHDDFVIALGIAAFCNIHEPVTDTARGPAPLGKAGIGSAVRLPSMGDRVTAGRFRNRHQGRV